MRDLALRHLARFETTETGLRRVLERAVDRWARRAGAEQDADREAVAEAAARVRALVGGIVEQVSSRGLVDDRRFAERRAALDARRGRSAQQSRNALRFKGVDASLAAATTRRSSDQEDRAALALLRRRRLGPFSAGEIEDEAAARHRTLAALARAGFGGDVARRVAGLDRAAAEELLARD